MAAAGAVSRKSSAAFCPLTDMTANPPPPTLPANGNVTASANAVATAASTAEPPLRSTVAPTRLASGASVTTIPCAAVTSGTLNGYGQAAGTAGGATPAAGCGPLWQPQITTEARMNARTLIAVSSRVSPRVHAVAT